MNQLHNDDCFNVIDTLETNSVDMVLVDLPYGQTDCDWDVCINLDIMWEKISRVGKDHCNYIFFVTTKFGNHIINSKPKWFIMVQRTTIIIELGNILIWLKPREDIIRQGLI